MSVFRFTILMSTLLIALYCGSASADVWKWMDANGDAHYVETSTSIFTWVEGGKVFYADSPGHEDAIAVQLIWVSKGSIADVSGDAEEYASPGETDEDRMAREASQAKACERATEIYASYKNAPRLYRTNDAGKREYLSSRDERATMAETKAKVRQLCQ